MEPRRVLVFPSGAARCALPLEQVREITEVARIVTVPGAPPAVAGLAEVRGRIVTLLDLGEAPPGRARDAACGTAVLFAEPFDHLGLLVRGGPGAVKPGLLAAGPPPDPTEPPPPGGPPAGRLALLADGEPAIVLDATELAEHGARKVRETFQVGRAE